MINVIKMFAAAAFAALGAAAYAQQPSQPAAAPPPQAVAAPSDAQVAPGRWDVERVRCSNLLGASDDDRAAATMFYYGYLAAKAGIHVVDVNKISDNIAKVMKQCSATPSMTVPHAFNKALAIRK